MYQITRAEYKTEPNSIKMKDLIRSFTEYYLPERKTYHNRGDIFWAKQTEEKSSEEFWRGLIEIERNATSTQSQRKSKNMTAITDKKLRDKLMKEKTLELKKIELFKQNIYKKKNKKNTIPRALISAQAKHLIEEEPTQRMERFGARPKNRPTGNRPCRFCGALNWKSLHKCPAMKQKLEKRTPCESVQTKQFQQPNSEKTNRRKD